MSERVIHSVKFIETDTGIFVEINGKRVPAKKVEDGFVFAAEGEEGNTQTTARSWNYGEEKQEAGWHYSFTKR